MGNVRLYGATSGYTELAPPAVAPDGVLSLPSGTGTIAKTTDQGLVHINTTTFSAVSSVSLNNVFTSAYQNYRIIIDGSSSADTELYQRLRLGGTDAIAANYNAQIFTATGTSLSGVRIQNQTLAYVGTPSGKFNVIIDIFNPQIAVPTTYLDQSGRTSNTPTVNAISGNHDVATSYDGITTYPGTGTITGTIRVYGYKNGTP